MILDRIVERARFGVACGAFGLALVLVGAAHAAPLAWAAPERVNAQAHLLGVSCPTESLCVAPSNDRFVISTRPAAGASSWAPTPEIEPPLGGDVSCVSASLCVATTIANEVLVSTNPTGGSSAWVRSPVFPAGSGDVVAAVSCASVSLCVAVGYHVSCVPSPITGVFCSSGGSEDAVTTDPRGGAGAWKMTELGGGTLNSVSCPSTKLCLAVGSGTVQSPSGPPYAVVVSSRNPTSRHSTWSVENVDGANTLNRVSCAGAARCVAVDGSGNAISSNDPSGGSAAWKIAHLSGNPLTDVSCASASLCVAVDDSGDAFTSTRPSAGTNDWTAIDIARGVIAPLSVSCPSVLLCVAVGPTGDVIVGSGPSHAKIKTLLSRDITPHRGKPTIESLLRDGGYRLSFTAPSAGSGSVSWYLVPPPKHGTKPKSHRVLIASGRIVFTAAGRAGFRMTLRAKGRTLLRDMKLRKGIKSLTFRAVGTFTPSGSRRVIATSQFVITA